MDIVMMLGGAHEWAVAIAYALFMAASGFVLVPDQTHALNQLPAAMNADGSAVMNTVQQLAGAIGTAVGGGDALDAARRSQLDHRGARILSIVRCSETALAKESISCDDRPAQRVMRVLRSQFAAGCLDQRVGQSLAAIGQRHHAAFGAGIAGRHAPAHRLSHGLRGSGFLERIRCQQIFHGQR